MKRTEINFKVLAINTQDAEKIQNAEQQFTTCGRNASGKRHKTKFAGKYFDLNKNQVESITDKLTKAKRKFFQLNIKVTTGMTKQEKEQRLKELDAMKEKGIKVRGRRPNLDVADNVREVAYLATMENGKVKVLGFHLPDVISK